MQCATPPHLWDVNDEVDLALLDVLHHVRQGAAVESGGGAAARPLALLRLREGLGVHLHTRNKRRGETWKDTGLSGAAFMRVESSPRPPPPVPIFSHVIVSSLNCSYVYHPFSVAPRINCSIIPVQSFHFYSFEKTTAGFEWEDQGPPIQRYAEDILRK